MAFDAYVKIEGIPGEALDDQHKDWIEITGYSFSTHQEASSTPVPQAVPHRGARPLATSHSPRIWTSPVASS